MNTLPDVSIILTVDAKYRISQAFGNADVPENAPYKRHNGIDLECPIGTPVYASASGTVRFAYDKDGYGYYVIIDHGGYLTLYAHLSEIIIKKSGVYVNAGDQIGLSGSSGFSIGPHLHFELRIPGNGEPGFEKYGQVNPLKYLADISTKRERWASVISGVNVRNTPDTSNNENLVGFLPSGIQVMAFWTVEAGGNTWASLSENGDRWSAVVYDDWQYLELEDA
jgi:hypothetical protein